MGVYVSKVKEAEANLHLVGGGRERVASPGGLKTRVKYTIVSLSILYFAGTMLVVSGCVTCLCSPGPKTCSVDRHGCAPRAKEWHEHSRYHACGAKSNALSLAMQAQVTSIDPADDRQHL